VHQRTGWSAPFGFAEAPSISASSPGHSNRGSAGTPLHEIVTVLSHRRLATTIRYAHHAPQRLWRQPRPRPVRTRRDCPCRGSSRTAILRQGSRRALPTARQHAVSPRNTAPCLPNRAYEEQPHSRSLDVMKPSRAGYFSGSTFATQSVVTRTAPPLRSRSWTQEMLSLWIVVCIQAVADPLDAQPGWRQATAAQVNSNPHKGVLS
jgi:hypothetical protein